MQKSFSYLTLLFLVWEAVAQPNSDPATYLGQDRTWTFHEEAGAVDTTAVWKDDGAITAWATGYTDLIYGDAVTENFRTPEKALGKAVGDSFDIVCLGRGGQITMTFANPITDGNGFDFAVFENGFSNTFLELGWVEVSTDGVHFVRFPNFSYTASSVGGFGSVNPTNIHGLASKYRQGYGTPFDLEKLKLAYYAAIAETDNFDSAYDVEFEANFPHLDLNEINYVRIIDVVGDGTAFDCEGLVIYDPYPTSGSAGFDLDAVAVINESTPAKLPQSIDFPAIGSQRLTDGPTQLGATSSSGLPVTFEVIEGPASLNGSILSFSGLGQVVVEASQAGDTTYAAATPVAQSFVVADELQHIYLEPIPNQLTGAANVQFYASSSSGLPVSLAIEEGSAQASLDADTNLFSSGSTVGGVEIRASQAGGLAGGVTYAPANDVFFEFEIVASGSANAPITFGDWQVENSISGAFTTDSDGDGASDFEEYVADTDPNDALERPVYGFEAFDENFVLELKVSPRALSRVQVLENTDLSDSSGWTSIVPEILSLQYGMEGDDALRRTLQLRVLKNGDGAFWRFDFSSN
ncbi:MAG: thrombospondin type 3 repeat-containing protein [Verrucomicrobiota bacterium]